MQQIMSVIDDGEYGYIPGRSREHAILHLSLLQQISTQQKKSLAIVQTDIEKAFDKVDRDILIDSIVEICGCKGVSHAIKQRNEIVIYTIDEKSAEAIQLLVPIGIVQGTACRHCAG